MALRGRDEFLTHSFRMTELEETSWTRALEGLTENGSLQSLTLSGSVPPRPLIMFMPYVIEKERSDLEKTQVAQQRQMLLGPSAAVQAAKQRQ
ncbi:hypothetical protein OSTOST_07984 [Ostertagia ostertagi]